MAHSSYTNCVVVLEPVRSCEPSKGTCLISTDSGTIKKVPSMCVSYVKHQLGLLVSSLDMCYDIFRIRADIHVTFVTQSEVIDDPVILTIRDILVG